MPGAIVTSREEPDELLASLVLTCIVCAQFSADGKDWPI